MSRNLKMLTEKLKGKIPFRPCRSGSKREISFLKRIKCFRSTLRWRSFLFLTFFYLIIAPYYNTYITYYQTDIDIKIQKYKAEIKMTIQLLYLQSLVCLIKREKNGIEKEKKKLLKNNKNAKSTHKSKTKRKNGNRTHTCTPHGTS